MPQILICTAYYIRLFKTLEYTVLDAEFLKLGKLPHERRTKLNTKIFEVCQSLKSFDTKPLERIFESRNENNIT